MKILYIFNNYYILIIVTFNMNLKQTNYYNIKIILTLKNYNIKAGILYLITLKNTTLL